DGQDEQEGDRSEGHGDVVGATRSYTPPASVAATFRGPLERVEFPALDRYKAPALGSERSPPLPGPTLPRTMTSLAPLHRGPAQSIATRDAYGRALLELGQERPDVVVLDADLSGSTKTKA